MGSPRLGLGLLVLALLVVACTDLSAQRVDPSQVGSTAGSSTLFPDSGNGGYQVVEYHWELDISEDLISLTGTATTKAVSTHDLRRFSLDSRGLEVTSVMVEGQDESDYIVEGNELVITVGELIPMDSDFEVTVEYAATPQPFQPQGTGLVMGWTVTPGEQLSVGGLPGSDATWVPVNEDVYDPARYVLSITVPGHFSATASGTMTGTADHGDATTQTWDTIVPVDGISFSVARYETFQTGDLEVSVQPGESPDRFFELIPPMIAFLEELYGPLPYRPLGLSTLTEKNFAISTPGRIFGPVDLPPVILVHELSHQWIGNAVSTFTLEDDWLIEGLAAYTETLWEESQGGADVGSRFARAAMATIGPTTRPLDTVESVEDLFDQQTIYIRGSLFYHALRLEIGDEAFFAMLRAISDRYSGNAITPGDIQALAEEMSGADLDTFFAAWVTEEAVPDLPGS